MQSSSPANTSPPVNGYTGHPPLLDLYQRMHTLRNLDAALDRLSREGLIAGPMHTGLGQEAVGIGATASLSVGDVTTATHRAHAQYVGLGLPLGPTIAEMMGRAGGQCGGRGGHMLISDPQRGLLGPSGVVGHSLLLAVGHGYRQRLRGTGRVTLCVTGDGAVNSGAFNEAANMVALWRLPVVILVENNRYGLSVRLDRHVQETSLHRRAEGYGMPGLVVDGNDVESVLDVVTQAVARARAGLGPTLVEALTYRQGPFSKADRGGYRPREEGADVADPLTVALERLIDRGTPPARLRAAEKAATRAVDDAVAYAVACPWPDPDELTGTAAYWDGEA